jgi:hypothetical protein
LRYIEALEKADRGDLPPLISLFASRQKRAFVGALGIAREVAQETERVDQVIEAIGDMYQRRDAAFRRELESAKHVAVQVWTSARRRFAAVSSIVDTLHRHVVAPGRDDLVRPHTLGGEP